MSIRELIDPQNSTLIFIDHQPQMSFGVANIDRQTLKNNTVALAKAGKIFNVPVIYTSVETKSFSGYIWPELLAVHPDVKPIERTSMNSWEDAAFVKAVEATGRKKLIISALWTEVCLTFPALMALEEGFEVALDGVPGPVFIECPVDLLYSQELVRGIEADLCAEGNGRAAHAVFGVDHVAAGRISVS